MRVRLDGDLPQADTLSILMCAHCEAVHVVLFDADARPMLIGTIAAADWERTVARIAAERSERAAAADFPAIMGHG